MRLSRFAPGALLARLAPLSFPFLTTASAAAPSSEAAPFSQASTAVDSSSDLVSYRLPLSVDNNDNEAYRFNIQAFAQPQDQACGDSQLRLHGQDLRRDWHSSADGDLIGTAAPSVVVRSERTGHDHDLGLDVSSSCLSSHATGAGTRASDAETDQLASLSAVEVTTVVVKSVSRKALDSPVGFTIYLDQSSGRLLQVMPASPQDLSRLSHNELASPDDRIFRERAHLELLKSKLERLTAQVVATEARIEELDHDASTDAACNTFSCAFTAFFRRIGGNIRILIQKLPSVGDSQQKCPRGQIVLGNCVPTASQQSSKTNTTASGHTTAPTAALRLDSTQDHVILSVIVIASIFCFTGVLFSVCRFCFSARTQAEWRASCEERRTRRQFRRLQRNHELKEWWNRLLGRPVVSRSSDYDEKRRLILSQEHVLENSMQDEIYRIRIDAGMTPDEAWAARRAADGTTDSLPPYRAQVTDGPPSYRTTPSDTGSVSLSRTGSASGDTPSVSDVTPDSSIANLSPRHSFETLRTEGSIV